MASGSLDPPVLQEHRCGGSAPGSLSGGGPDCTSAPKVLEGKALAERPAAGLHQEGRRPRPWEARQGDQAPTQPDFHSRVMFLCPER